jgi:hypothetical protein
MYNKDERGWGEATSSKPEGHPSFSGLLVAANNFTNWNILKA